MMFGHVRVPGVAELSYATDYAYSRYPSMFDAIIKLLTEPSASPGRDGLEVAVAVLLVEAARMDDHFDDTERHVIERLLSQKFQLSPEQTRELLRKAVETDE